MRRSGFGLFLLLLGPVLSQYTNVYQTTNGPIRGYIEDNVQIFRGMPFAAPPVGDLRLKAPQPVTPWTKVKTCESQAPICPQVRITNHLFIGNEDCLYMDVYVPNVKSTTPFPVMVWLFGGGYVFGDGYEFGFYDGKNLVNKHQFILVAPNYRLGSLGFMALDQLKQEDPNASTGNYALQDQTQALQWVQANIAAFGGSPSQVTIIGESAGAFSVAWHLVSPTSMKLFRAAVMESGTFDSDQFFVSYDNSVAWSETFSQMVGCDPADPDVLTCLRNLPTATILGHVGGAAAAAGAEQQATNQHEWAAQQHKRVHAAQHALAERGRLRLGGFTPQLYPAMPWGPTIDGSPVGLMGVPLALIKAGAWANVPVIAGTNENEGSIFLPAVPLMIPGVKFPLDEAAVNLTLMHFFNNQTFVNSVFDVYPLYQFKNPDHQAGAVLRDYFFACASRRGLAAMLSAGQANVFLYHFTYKGDFIEDPFLGDYHSSELPFVFDNPWPPIVHHFSQNDATMANTFGTFWSNMIHFANPNGNNNMSTPVYWPAFTEPNPYNVILEVPAYTEEDLFQEQCNWWDANWTNPP